MGPAGEMRGDGIGRGDEVVRRRRLDLRGAVVDGTPGDAAEKVVFVALFDHRRAGGRCLLMFVPGQPPVGVIGEPLLGSQILPCRADVDRTTDLVIVGGRIDVARRMCDRLVGTGVFDVRRDVVRPRRDIRWHGPFEEIGVIRLVVFDALFEARSVA